MIRFSEVDHPFASLARKISDFQKIIFVWQEGSTTAAAKPYWLARPQARQPRRPCAFAELTRYSAPKGGNNVYQRAPQQPLQILLSMRSFCWRM